jgi:hypothetical protein
LNIELILNIQNFLDFVPNIENLNIHNFRFPTLKNLRSQREGTIPRKVLMKNLRSKGIQEKRKCERGKVLTTKNLRSKGATVLRTKILQKKGIEEERKCKRANQRAPI